MSNIIYGQKTVASTATPEQITTSIEKAFVITVKALSTNTGFIYVGDAGVTSSNGFVLEKSEEVSIFIDNVETDVYIACSVNGEGVSYMGWEDKGILYQQN